MSLRLYHSPRSRSARVVWLVEESGQPLEIVQLTREERQGDEHRGRHPLGHVPVLEDDVGFLHESAALCLQLADLHPEANLNFALGTHERGLVYQWTVFAMSELERAAIAFHHHEDDPARAQSASDYFQEAAQPVERALDEDDFLVGGRLTVADVVCGSVLFFAERSGLTGGLDAITRYLRRLEDRPAYRRAMA